jgi:hypothetical protein
MPREPLPIDDRHPDDATQLLFGDPVYQLVSQPGLQVCALGSYTVGDRMLTVEVSYWTPNDTGGFGFAEFPAESLPPMLRGRVFTGVPGAAGGEQAGGDGVGDERAALVEHLQDVVVNDRINRPDFAFRPGGDEWLRETQRWRRQMEGVSTTGATLDVDGRTVRGLSGHFDAYSATAARVGDRMVTLVLHDDDAVAIDTRLVRRPPVA